MTNELGRLNSVFDEILHTITDELDAEVKPEMQDYVELTDLIVRLDKILNKLMPGTH